jgi:hypothetical protein
MLKSAQIHWYQLRAEGSSACSCCGKPEFLNRRGACHGNVGQTASYFNLHVQRDGGASVIASALLNLNLGLC